MFRYVRTRVTILSGNAYQLESDYQNWVFTTALLATLKINCWHAFSQECAISFSIWTSTAPSSCPWPLKHQRETSDSERILSAPESCLSGVVFRELMPDIDTSPDRSVDSAATALRSTPSFVSSLVANLFYVSGILTAFILISYMIDITTQSAKCNLSHRLKFRIHWQNRRDSCHAAA